MPEIIEHQLGSLLSLGVNPPCEADLHIFEVLASLDVLVLRYESIHGFITRGVGTINIEMRGVLQFPNDA